MITKVLMDSQQFTLKICVLESNCYFASQVCSRIQFQGARKLLFTVARILMSLKDDLNVY